MRGLTVIQLATGTSPNRALTRLFIKIDTNTYIANTTEEEATAIGRQLRSATIYRAARHQAFGIKTIPAHDNALHSLADLI